MDKINIEGLKLTPLQEIKGDLGNVLHCLKASEDSFETFGEAYFSTIKNRATKGWKKHRQMLMNLVVPVGKIKFVLFDDRSQSSTQGNFFEVILSRENYQRLTVPSGLFMAFHGLAENESILINIASIGHDPEEAENLALDHTKFAAYEW